MDMGCWGWDVVLGKDVSWGRYLGCRIWDIGGWDMGYRVKDIGILGYGV